MYKEEVYEIIGRCMEVHNILGHGFSEVIYKDALEIEFIENRVGLLKKENTMFSISSIYSKENIVQTLRYLIKSF